MDNTEEENHIYGPETMICYFTNRPFSGPKQKTVTFWCNICCVRLAIRAARPHFSGKPHILKLKKATMQVALKRKHENSDESESTREPSAKNIQESDTKEINEQSEQPGNKKIKKQPEKTASKNNKEPSESDLKCDDCNRVFLSVTIALQHFKGNKHAAVVSNKLAKRGQIGRRVRGMGGGFDRGRGFMRGGVNNYSGFGKRHAAGQLIAALKNFYGDPPVYNRMPSTARDYQTSTTTEKDNFDMGSGNNYGYSDHRNNNPTKSNYQMTSDLTYDSFYR